jgi:hypothetical protein
MTRSKTVIICILTSLLLSSCSTYPSKFRGDPAKGTWGALPMDVDRMVDNNEVESVYRSPGKIKDYETRSVESEYPVLKNDDMDKVVYADEV